MSEIEKRKADALEGAIVDGGSRGEPEVRIEVGDIDQRVPGDREDSFEPLIIPKHARRLAGFGEAVVSLFYQESHEGAALTSAAGRGGVVIAYEADTIDPTFPFPLRLPIATVSRLEPSPSCVRCAKSYHGEYQTASEHRRRQPAASTSAQAAASGSATDDATAS